MKSRFSGLVLAGAMALSPMAANAEVIKQDDRGFATRAVAQVAASPREAWIALIAPGKWWNDAHTFSGDAGNMTITPQAGGCFCEKIPASGVDGAPPLAGGVRHMTVVMAMPDQALRMRGGLGPLQSEPADGVLTVTLKPIDGGTQILWEYVVGGYLRYEVPMISKAVDGVMDQQLNGLADLLGRMEEKEPAGASGGEMQGPDLEEDAASAEEAQPGPARQTVDEAFEDIGR